MASATITDLRTDDLSRQSRTWQLGGGDSTARLEARILGGHSLHATLGDVTGRLVLADDGTPEQVEVRIDADNLDTGDPRRDQHLRSSAFLDTRRHPHVCFRSSRIDTSRPGQWRVHADLRIRDVTRPVQVDVTYTQDACRARIRVRGDVDRSDFGLMFNRVLERTFRVGTEMVLEADIAADGCSSAPVASPCDLQAPDGRTLPALAA